MNWKAPTVAPLPESYSVTCTPGDLVEIVGSETTTVTLMGIQPGVDILCQVVSVREEAESDPEAADTVKYRYDIDACII